MTKHIRQGDLLITKVDKIPSGLKKDLTGIILFGEATGHKHQLFGGDVFKGKEGLIFLNVPKKAEIRHEEHRTIKLGAGKFAVIRQREYLNSDMVKLVVD